jgi:hypothetical protein
MKGRRDRAAEEGKLNRSLAACLQQAHHIEMRKKTFRAFRARGKYAASSSLLDERIAVTFSPELSKLIVAEIERSGKTAEEIAECAVRLHCVEAAAEIFEVKP